MQVNLLKLIDESKCFDLLREIRWPNGVHCTNCTSTNVIKNRHDDNHPNKQRYQCHFGRMIPILLSLATLIVFSIVLFWDKSNKGFLIAVCAGNFGINLVIPYMSAVIDELDDSGKGVAMVPAMYSIGLFLGTIVLSFFMSEPDSSMTGYVAAAFFLGCLG